MLVSYNWLKKYIKLPGSVSPEELALKLTMSTVEVDSINKQGENLENIVVGKIVSLEKHPKADKLQLCKVDIGGEELPVVCGGSNLSDGMLVALAKVGAKVYWHNERELVELKPTAIRGVESQGMICASTEIGLGEMFPSKDGHEILDLSKLVKKSVVGRPIAEVFGLNDVIFEIDNKSMTHRPDLWGHYGLAREVAALYGREVDNLKTKKIKSGKKNKLTVTVENKEDCPRYMAARIDGVKVGPSPDWMKKILFAVGLRPINNLVDITNYLMLELGQPMHAFDVKKLIINNDKLIQIIVRRAKDKEKLKLLDGREVNLDPSILVIADAEKPLALAGVMGGESSAIEPDTTGIILESATFEPILIRRAALKLDCRTDSSTRFEKSLDPVNAKLALEKAVDMILELCPDAEVSSVVVDKANYNLKQGPINVSSDFLRRKIGLNISTKEIILILERLGFEVKESNEELSVKIPTWRATKDISIVEDLVEEVARIYGYDNIIPTLPTFPIIPPPANKLRQVEHRVRTALIKEFASTEVCNYSFISREQADKISDKDEYAELDKPLSKEKPLLRRNLLPNLLENIVMNIENFDEIKILEIGKTFLLDLPGPRVKENSDELLPKQDTWASILYAGKKDNNPFVAVRRAAEIVMVEFHLPLTVKKPSVIKPWMHPTRAGEIMIGEKSLGYIYETSPATAKKFGLDARVGVLEINLDELSLVAADSKTKNYEKLPEFPEVSRDLAFTVDKKLAHEKIAEELSGIDMLIKKIELFDVYEGEHVQKEKKSMAYRLIFAHPEKTLNSAEVDKVMEQVIALLHKKYQAEIRA